MKFKCLEDNFKCSAPLVADRYSNHQMALSIGFCFIPIFINVDNLSMFSWYLKGNDRILTWARGGELGLVAVPVIKAIARLQF